MFIFDYLSSAISENQKHRRSIENTKEFLLKLEQITTVKYRYGGMWIVKLP